MMGKNIIKEEADKYQGLFNLMSNEHNLTLTISEMDDVIIEAGNVLKLFTPFVVIKCEAEQLICPGCGSKNININHSSQSFKCKDCFDGWAD